MEAGKLDEYLKHADDQMKLSNGHSFVTMLKTRCQYCGRSPASMGRCPDWFKTFIDNFKLILRENGEILEQVAPTASHDSQS